MENATSACEGCDLPLVEPLPRELDLDLEYERKRWLPAEPILYIGKASRSIANRMRSFYRHKCGDNSPHAGGQVLKLLQPGLWVYWAAVADAYETEQAMIKAFEKEAHQPPFANYGGERRRRRILCLRTS